MATFDRLFEMDWDEFYGLVLDQASNEEWLWKYDTLEERLRVLEEAHYLFGQYDEFSCMETCLRKHIAGVAKRKELYGCAEDVHQGYVAGHNEAHNSLESHWFGIMLRAKNKKFNFEREIERNNQGISEALSYIPLMGRVTYSDFESFVDSFCRALNIQVESTKALGTATRLLVYKRPDYFVSFNGASEKMLSQVYTRSSVPKVSVDPFLKDYWRKVIAPIIGTRWWDSSEPESKNGLEARVWRCRAAILDVLFYEPEELHPTRSPKIDDVSERLERYLESRSWNGSTRITQV